MTQRLPDTPDEAFEEDPHLAAVRARVHDAGREVSELYRALGNVPWLLEAWVDFAWDLRARPRTSRALRELAIMRVAQLSGAEYEWVHHWRFAVEAGLDEAKLVELDAWEASAVYTPIERTVLTAADRLVAESKLDDQCWADLARELGDDGALETVMTIAFYCCVSRVLGALAIVPDPSDVAAAGPLRRLPNPNGDAR